MTSIEVLHHKDNSAGRIRVAHLIYSPAVGGSEVCAVEICSHLDRSLYDPLVLFMYSGDGPMPAILAQRGIPAYGLKRTRVRRLLWPLLPALTLRRLKIDLLHVHHLPLLVAILPALRLAGIGPVVFTEHAKFSISRSPELQQACQRLATKVECFTTVSEDLKSYFVNVLGIPSDIINVIHNGVDTVKFSFRESSATLSSLLPSQFSGAILITVGRLTDAKDHALLLAAMEILKEGQVRPYLLIVGDGELRPFLEKEISRRRLSQFVSLVGNRSDIEQLLPRANAFVLSSKREGLPMALLEAMSAALPVIATSVGGVPEVVRNGFNGLLVPPEDPAALASAIDCICNDNTLAKSLGNNARKTIKEKFSLDKVAQSYSRIYQDLVRKV